MLLSFSRSKYTEFNDFSDSVIYSALKNDMKGLMKPFEYSWEGGFHCLTLTVP